MEQAERALEFLLVAHFGEAELFRGLFFGRHLLGEQTVESKIGVIVKISVSDGPTIRRRIRKTYPMIACLF